jgi:hypothetical protein
MIAMKSRANEMSRTYLALDIETAKAVPTGCDWRQARPLGIACAATLLDGATPLLWYGGTGNRPAARMRRDDAEELTRYLAKCMLRGYTIITWNGVGFDFEVLAEESGRIQTCRRLAATHVDMMFHALCQLGHGIGLDAAAKGMDLPGKYRGLSGSQIPALWQHGKRRMVLDYLVHEVQMTLNVAKVCEKCAYLRWITGSGRRREMQLPRGWLSVKSANRLPERATPWMFSEWSRRRFTAWLRLESRPDYSR